MRSWALLAAAHLALACGSERVDSDTGAPEADAGLDATARDATSRRCNGRADLCDRSYERVVFPGAHNAHAALEYGYAGIANQESGFDTQLADGIRVFLADVYLSDTGESIFCHSVCSIASTPHADALATVSAFFDEHPDDVITFIYEDHVDTAVIADDIRVAGLEPFAFTHDPGAPWPTLAEMIDSGKRLVVTLENGGPPPPWAHHVWDVAFDTPYTFTSIDAMSCDLNRGSADNDLMLVNHWISQDNGLPSQPDAAAANAYDVLYGRASRCAGEASHVPNFVAVDFYAVGDLFAVVDALNDDAAAGRL